MLSNKFTIKTVSGIALIAGLAIGSIPSEAIQNLTGIIHVTAQAPTDATYITQTANGGLSAEQALGLLSSGIMRSATTTGVVTVLTDSAGIAANISDETGTGALLFATAPTLTGPVVLTEAVGSSGLTITGATQTTSFPALNITQTWNAGAVTFTAAKINVTNTASATTSNILDLQRGATSKLRVNYAGGVFISANENTNQSLFDISAGVAGATQVFNVNGFGAAWLLTSLNMGSSSGLPSLTSSKLQMPDAGLVTWGSTDDIRLARDASGILAQRFTTTAQSYKLYETFTDASNYERLAFTTGSNVFSILAETAGTGSDDLNIVITAAGTGIVTSGSVFKAAGYQSSDGTAGATQTCATPVTAATVKNGLITAITCP